MLYKELIAVCSEILRKHINILCEQNVELLNVRPGGTHSYHWVLKGLGKAVYDTEEETNTGKLHLY